MAFSPDAMVRAPQRDTMDTIQHPSRLRPRQWDEASRDDSRVAETFDDSPDPEMPLQPLRLEFKEKSG